MIMHQGFPFRASSMRRVAARCGQAARSNARTAS